MRADRMEIFCATCVVVRQPLLRSGVPSRRGLAAPVPRRLVLILGCEDALRAIAFPLSAAMRKQMAAFCVRHAYSGRRLAAEFVARLRATPAGTTE